MKSKKDNREHPYMGKNYRISDFTNDRKHGNAVPDGETRTRGQMIVQHASWYLLAMYPKLDKNIWDAHLILEACWWRTRVTV